MVPLALVLICSCGTTGGGFRVASSDEVICTDLITIGFPEKVTNVRVRDECDFEVVRFVLGGKYKCGFYLGNAGRSYFGKDATVSTNRVWDRWTFLVYRRSEATNVVVSDILTEFEGDFPQQFHMWVVTTNEPPGFVDDLLKGIEFINLTSAPAESHTWRDAYAPKSKSEETTGTQPAAGGYGREDAAKPHR